ncbi:hypothetical protein SAMN05216167_14913 [Spirosoma endophyticum]|uniref:Uncharacterized protein n=2 Tax=Spirosoma endophyticum TaxID=662367 RepID=A0A1I2HXX5_9BACT|nr:hypothetical protein SAMN05216167_14913 [Spirosoma endophyticum]
MGFIVPLLFIGRAYKPLVRKCIYGQKAESVYVPDKRFDSGLRYKGKRFVVDIENKYYLTDQQRTIARAEGALKLCLICLAILWVALKPEKIKTIPKAPLTINNIRIGTPLSVFKKQQNNTIKYMNAYWRRVENAEYGKISGKLEIYIRNKRINGITFIPSDTSTNTNRRLAKMLYAEYGPAQDASDGFLHWENDSIKLSLYPAPYTNLDLHRNIKLVTWK